MPAVVWNAAAWNAAAWNAAAWNAATRNAGGAAIPDLKMAPARHRLLAALKRSIERLVPPRPGRESGLPPEFFYYPPF